MPNYFANLTVILFSMAVILYNSNTLRINTEQAIDYTSIAQLLILKMELPFHYDTEDSYMN